MIFKGAFAYQCYLNIFIGAFIQFSIKFSDLYHCQKLNQSQSTRKSSYCFIIRRSYPKYSIFALLLKRFKWSKDLILSFLADFIDTIQWNISYWKQDIIFMSKSSMPKCSSCRTSNILIGRYCCDPQEMFCQLCASNPCRRCKRKRTNIQSIDKIKSTGRISTVKFCNLCQKMQTLIQSKHFNEPQCQQNFCYSCIAKCYGRFDDNIDVSVDLPCKCKYQKKIILDYLQRYCYHCQKDFGFIPGEKMILKNQCKINKKCFNQLKREASKSYASQEIKRKWQIIQSNIIECMNCKAIIDGKTKFIGDKINGLFICDVCLRLTKMQETQFQISKLTKSKMTNQSILKPQQSQNIQACTKKIQDQREPVQQSKNKKPYLINAPKYYVHSKCQRCNATILEEKSICDNCIALQKRKKPQITLQEQKKIVVEPNVIPMEAGSAEKKEKSLSVGEPVSVKTAEKKKDKADNLATSANQSAFKKKQQVLSIQQSANTSIAEKKQQLESQKPSVSTISVKKKQPSSSVEKSSSRQSDQSMLQLRGLSASINVADKKTQSVKAQSKQQKEKVVKQAQSKQKKEQTNVKVEKESIQMSSIQQKKFDEISKINLKQNDEDNDQEFFPFIMQPLSIKISQQRLKNHCYSCHYVFEDKIHLQSYQRQSGNQQSLSIAETQNQKAKYSKENKLQIICNSCYLFLKLKELKVKQKKSSISKDHSDSPRSLPKKPKQEQDRSRMSLTDTKKVEPNKKPEYDKDFLCIQCYKFFKRIEFDENRRTCKICSKKDLKVWCRNCLKEFTRKGNYGSQEQYCQKCKYRYLEKAY